MRLAGHRLWASFLLAVAGCGGASIVPNGQPGEAVECPDGSKRMTVSCASITTLKGRVVSANAGIPQIGLGIGGAYEETAIQQISTSTQQLAIELDNKCAQYNACAIDAETWLASEQRLQQHVAMLERAPSSPDATFGDAVWTNAVPELSAKRLELRYQVQARAPGGEWSVHENGQALRSGDELRFALLPSQSAYVYVLLLASDGAPSQMFPLSGVGVDNPVDGGRPVLVPDPSAGVFTLDETTGREHIQIVASSQALADIEQRLAGLSSGAPTTAAQGKELLQSIGGLLCDQAPEGQRNIAFKSASQVACGQTMTRGIPFRASGASAPAVVQRARPNDGVIVVQHEVDHQGRDRPAAPSRGLSVGQDGFLK